MTSSRWVYPDDQLLTQDRGDGQEAREPVRGRGRKG